MSASLSSSSTTTVRAGLIYQAVSLGEHLRLALSEVGVKVVSDSTAQALASATFDTAEIDVFVVNLDPELEDHLDNVTDLLDRFDRPVIFNDGAASSGLAGWDQARWARHLASKIRGELHANPPRPIDAPSIPMPAKKPTTVAPKPVAPKPAIAVAPVAVAAVAPRGLPVTAEIKAVPETPRPQSDVAAPSADVFDGLNFDDLDNASTFTNAAAPSTAVATTNDDVAFDLADIDSIQFSTDEPASDSSGFVGFDDSAFDFDAPVAPVSELDDLDHLLAKQPVSAPVEIPLRKPDARSAEANNKPVDAKAATSEAKAAAESKKAELKDAPMSWSLEPLDGEQPLAATSGKAVFGAREVPVIEPVKKPPSAPPAPVAASADSELADFDFFDNFDAPPAKAATPVAAPALTPALTPAPTKAAASPTPATGTAFNAELEDLFAEFNVSDVAPTPVAVSPKAAAISASADSFDFDVDFEMNEISAPAGATRSAAPTSLGQEEFADLDALFSDPPPATKPPTRSADSSASPATGPSHVVVLGASIGGPEAVRTFLGKIKPTTKCGFVLAQHMGAEFLDLMTSQLAKATTLNVKLAKPGEPFSDGDVLVVPVTHRFLIDAQGAVRFDTLPGESPYSPSIDQVMMDMSDRFRGRCTGIIFSGMASDAIEGAKHMANQRASVWVQDPSTCVISSMIDGAQAAGVVSFVGAPEQLAEHLVGELSRK